MAPKTEDFASREEAKRAWFDDYVAKREAELKPWQSWWEEVKSGQRTFSFKGQAVKYRFRPDGTWEAIPIANPPDDGPKPVPATAETEKQTAPSDTADAAKPDHRSMWWWIAGAGGLLIVVACGLFRKSRKVG